MAANCAVVCTNVGGMTNIIINDYNGVLIEPEEEALYKALKRLIVDNHERQILALHGHETLVSSFSLIKWHNSWMEILQNG